MKSRTTQDLLAERRANIQKARRMKRAPGYRAAQDTLLAHVLVIDAELEHRRQQVVIDAGDRKPKKVRK